MGNCGRLATGRDVTTRTTWWLAAFALLWVACGDDSAGGGEDSAGAPMMPAAPMMPIGGCANPGQMFSCECGPGQRGTQSCLGSGELSTCLCGNANPENQRRACDPSQPLRLTCDCEDGRPGLQLCGDDGILQPCDCDLPEFQSGDAGVGTGDEDAG